MAEDLENKSEEQGQADENVSPKTEDLGTQDETKSEETETKADEAATKEEVEDQKAEEIDPKDAKIAELEDQLLRAKAEFANYKRRTTEEMFKLGTYTTAQVVEKFLTVLDNFERAEEQVQKMQNNAEVSDALNAVVEGMQKIRKQFDETFKKLEVEEIAALNEKFDPNLHEAVMRGANPELADETIDMVLQKGYKIREQIIRHSKVRVISNQ